MSFSRQQRAELEARVRELIENQSLQQWKAAEALGVSVSWVERACTRLSLRTAKTGPRRGPEHPDWKGGRYLVGGYWYVWRPDHPNATKVGYVAEHRLVMSERLGRPLLRTEVVHHRNGDPQDNRPENLEVFPTNSDHLRHELKGRRPNWTAEGFARMRENGRRIATLNRQRADDRRRLRSTPPECEADSTGEAPAS